MVRGLGPGMDSVKDCVTEWDEGGMSAVTEMMRVVVSMRMALIQARMRNWTLTPSSISLRRKPEIHRVILGMKHGCRRRKNSLLVLQELF